MADYFDGVTKYVVSNTLERVDWRNSTLLRGEDLVASIQDLKPQPGGDILMSASGTLVTSLLEAELVDEVQRRRMTFVDSTTFSTGVLSLTYRAIRVRAATPETNAGASA